MDFFVLTSLNIDRLLGRLRQVCPSLLQSAKVCQIFLQNLQRNWAESHQSYWHQSSHKNSYFVRLKKYFFQTKIPRNYCVTQHPLRYLPCCHTYFLCFEKCMYMYFQTKSAKNLVIHRVYFYIKIRIPSVQYFLYHLDPTKFHVGDTTISLNGVVHLRTILV